MSEDNMCKLYDVYVPISGRMRIYIRAKNEQDAMEYAKRIAKEIETDSSDTIIPNLFGWKLDRTVRPIVIERGESDD